MATAEEPPSAVRRFLAQFALHAAHPGRGGGHLAVIKQWSTSIVLIVITLFNAWSGCVGWAGPRAR